MEEQKLLEKINRATSELTNLLPKPEELDISKAKTLIKRQVAAFEGNFVVWLSSILITAKADKTKKEAFKNLREELEGNHAGLLRNFAKSGNALPDKEDFDFLENEVAEVRKLISEMSGLKNLVLLTVLEDTAPNCMAVLQKAAKLIDASDTAYADMHYELDVQHSKDFKDSLYEEVQQYESPESAVDEATDKALNLLKKIWSL